jgi:Flp pilus assembly protein TadD
LESVFWEKVAFYEEFQMKIPEAVAALKNGTKDGYDAAQFYNKLGVLFTLFANKEEAKSYFEKALKCQVNRTTAAENLKRLETM